jgi:chromosome partitioning protein
MALIIGVVSQKGGVGKSTIARLIAREYAANELNVLIADLDLSQSTSFTWNGRRLDNDLEPVIAVQQFRKVEAARKLESSYDVIIFDGAPHATRQTLDIARFANMIVIPTGTSLDDLIPTVQLAHELKKNNVPVKKIAVLFSRVGNSQVELDEAAEYIQMAGYKLLKGALPERTAYRRASDAGKAATETTHASTNERADEVVQSVINQVEKLLS